MKVFIEATEWYPVFSLYKENKPYLTQHEVEVTEEFFDKVTKLEEAFEEMQEILAKLPSKTIPRTEKLW